MIVGSVAFVLFSYGKKAHRPPHLLAGIVLFADSYIAPSPLWSYVGAAVVCGALWFAVTKMGL